MFNPQLFPLAHLAVAVESITQSGSIYRALGFTLSEPEELVTQQVRAQVAQKDGMRIELLEPLQPGAGPIGKFLNKNGPGLHHVALRTNRLEAELKQLEAQGIRLLPGYPATGLHGTRVAFLDPKTTGGVLFELVQAEAGGTG